MAKKMQTEERKSARQVCEENNLEFFDVLSYESYAELQEINRIYLQDCLKGMAEMEDNSVDLILCDLPYATLGFAWDEIIPFNELWKQYNRVIKPYGRIVLFGSEPFYHKVIASNPENFIYEWIWDKGDGNFANFLQAHYRTLKRHENIAVFTPDWKEKGIHKPLSRETVYNYQEFATKINKTINGTRKADFMGRAMKHNEGYVQEYTGFPDSILHFNKEAKGKSLHATQKPVALLEYLIKLYTHPGMLVLDNCMGSASTAIACINTNRNFIGFETDPEYYKIGNIRVANRLREKVIERKAAEKLNKDFTEDLGELLELYSMEYTYYFIKQNERRLDLLKRDPSLFEQVMDKTKKILNLYKKKRNCHYDLTDKDDIMFALSQVLETQMAVSGIY